MNFKTTYVLFGLLLVMLAGLFVVLWRGSDTATSENAVFPSFKSKKDGVKRDSIATVEIERLKPDLRPLTFQRDGKGWKITQPRALPAEGLRVDELIDALADARAEESAKSLSKKEAGLDSPTRVVKLTTADGKELKLSIGEVTAGGRDALAYVASSERGGKVLAVKRDSIATALENLNYFRSKEPLGELTNRDLIRLTRSDSKQTVELRKVNGRWVLTQPNYGTADVAKQISALESLRVSHTDDKKTDFVADETADLAKFNLQAGKSPVFTLHVEGGGLPPKDLLVAVGKKEEEKYTAALATGPKSGKYDVFKVPAATIDDWVKVFESPEALRGKALVDLGPAQEIDAIDIEEGKSKLAFRKEGAGWKLYRDGKSVKVDDAEVRKLIDDLTKRDAITSFLDPKTLDPKTTPRAYMGVDRTDVVTVSLYADSLPRPDLKKPDDKKPDQSAPKPDKLVATVRFGPTLREGAAVERLWGKDGTLAFVSDDLAKLVRRGAVAYLPKAVEPFNPLNPTANVTKVEVARDGTKYELTRSKDDAPWTFAAPPAMKGKKASDNAVRALLGAVNRPMILSVERETATPADLKAFGLDSPAAKITVTVSKDKKTETHTYEIGKETDKGVYFKVAGQGPVYLANKLMLADAKQDLRDPTIFSFKADDAATIKVTFYNELEGKAVTWAFEKKGGQWVRAGAADWAVNQDRVKDLLTELSTLRADKFVPAPKGMAVNAADQAITLEVVTADKKAHQVTLGAAEGASFYATSPQHAGTAFLVPQAPFSELKKQKVAYLRK